MRTRGSGPRPSSAGGVTRLDGGDAPVGRGDDQAVAQRRHAVGIAEEVGDLQRGDDEHPAERRPDEEEDQRQRRRRWR